MVKASAYNVGHPGSIPGSGRSPGEGNGNPLQCSCLENPMDGEACQAAVHGVTKSRDMTEQLHSFFSSLQHTPVPSAVFSVLSTFLIGPWRKMYFQKVMPFFSRTFSFLWVTRNWLTGDWIIKRKRCKFCIGSLSYIEKWLPVYPYEPG